MFPRSLLATLALTAVAASAMAAVSPKTVGFMGVLNSAAGGRQNGPVSLTLSLYADPTGGTPLWTETQNVTATKGLFTAALGSVTPFPSSLDFSQAYYVGVTVAGDSDELSPRIPLQGVPYAMFAQTVADGSVTSAKLASDAASLNKVTGGAVTVAGGNVGIGTASPLTALDVNGTAKMTGFQLPTNAAANSVLTSDGSGNGTWQALPELGPNSVDSTLLADDPASLGKITNSVLGLTFGSAATDQQQTIQNSSVGSNAYQSFTAGVSGLMTAFDFYLGNGNRGGTAFFGIYAGDATSSGTGDLLFDQTVSVNGGTGWQTFTFPNPIPVVAGQTYTIFVGNISAIAFAGSFGNPYPGGHSDYGGVNTDYDFAFRTYVRPASVTASTTVNLGGDVRVGSANQYFVPAAQDDVRMIAGQISGSAGIMSGSGFTVTRAAGRPVGCYQITFTTPFTSPPTIAVTPNASAFIAPQYYLDTANSVQVFMAIQGGYADAPFHFIAVGGR